MKSHRSVETSHRRQQLARLLRTVRSLRHEALPVEQRFERLNAAAAVAGDVMRFVRITAAQSAVAGDTASLRLVVDKSLLAKAEQMDSLQSAYSAR